MQGVMIPGAPHLTPNAQVLGVVWTVPGEERWGSHVGRHLPPCALASYSTSCDSVSPPVNWNSLLLWLLLLA